MSQYNQYNQYIYRNGEGLLIGDGGSSATYTLSRSGSNLTLTGSDSSTSTVSLNDFVIKGIPNTAYSQGDMVFYDGNIYQANTNLAPSSTFGTVSHIDINYTPFSAVGDTISEIDKGLLDGNSFMEKIKGADHGKSLFSLFYDETSQEGNYSPVWIIKGEDDEEYGDMQGVFLHLYDYYTEGDNFYGEMRIRVVGSHGSNIGYYRISENPNESYYSYELYDDNYTYYDINTFNFSKFIDISTGGSITFLDSDLITASGIVVKHKVTVVVVGDGTKISEIPNATSTNVGGIKVRLDTDTNTLYITNDGSNA